MADRYSYFPSIGLAFAMAWLAFDLLGRGRLGRILMWIAVPAMLLVCLTATRVQAGYWKDTQTLFGHTLAVTKGNFVAHDQLGEALARAGKREEARAHFDAALRLNPNYPPSLSNMSQLLMSEGRFEEAAELLKRLLASHPDHAVTHSDLAMALAHQGKAEEAMPHYLEALRLKPSQPEILNNLAWLLATHPRAELRDGARAVSLAEKACELTSRTNFWMLSTLAAAYAEAGKFPEAVSTQQKVCSLSKEQGVAGQQLESFDKRMELYRAEQPYRQP
jgi:Flp pilus assembly protein TadD